MNKCKKLKKKDTLSLISTILSTDRHIWYVCVSLHLLSSKLLFYLIFGEYGCHTWQSYMVLILRGKWGQMYLPSPICTVLITESQIFYVCVGLHLFPLQMLVYLIFDEYSCMVCITSTSHYSQPCLMGSEYFFSQLCLEQIYRQF